MLKWKITRGSMSFRFDSHVIRVKNSLFFEICRFGFLKIQIVGTRCIIISVRKPFSHNDTIGVSGDRVYVWRLQGYV